MTIFSITINSTIFNSIFNSITFIIANHAKRLNHPPFDCSFQTMRIHSHPNVKKIKSHSSQRHSHVSLRRCHLKLSHQPNSQSITSQVHGRCSLHIRQHRQTKRHSMIRIRVIRLCSISVYTIIYF